MLVFLILIVIWNKTKEKRMKGENDISPIELIKFFRGLLLADLHVPSLSFYGNSVSAIICFWNEIDSTF